MGVKVKMMSMYDIAQQSRGSENHHGMAKGAFVLNAKCHTVLYKEAFIYIAFGVLL
jgi:hypothetical protein